MYSRSPRINFVNFLGTIINKGKTNFKNLKKVNCAKNN